MLTKGRAGNRTPVEAKQAPLASLVGLVVIALAFVPEFGSGTHSPPRVYDVAVGPLRWVDVLVLGCASVAWLASRPARPRIPRTLVLPMLLAALGLAGGLLYGALDGGTQMFFDWRNLALGVVVAVVSARVIASRGRVEAAIRCLFAVSGGYALWLLAVYLAGGGVDTLATGRIPVFDGPTLSVFAFVGILAFSIHRVGATQFGATVFAGVPCALVVLLAMRRTYWGELLIGVIVVAVVTGLLRGGRIVPVVIVVGVAILAIGGSDRVTQRIESFDVNNTRTPAAVTNNVHLNDVRDALDRVKSSPVFGFGLGRPFQVVRTQALRGEEVWGVHNAPLHVWLRYGAVGLVAYLLWHLRYVKYLLSLRRSLTTSHPLAGAICAAVGAWTASAFTMGLFFSPWPYGSLQLALVIGAAAGVVFGWCSPLAATPTYESADG